MYTNLQHIFVHIIIQITVYDTIYQSQYTQHDTVTITSIAYPDRMRDRKYPNMLKKKTDTEADTARCFLGTTLTRMPEQAGNTDPPKNRINHRHTMK